MAKKKSFSIGSSLSQALTDTVSAAKNYNGELHIEIIPLRKIKLDDNNPRELKLVFHDVLNGINKTDPNYVQKLAEKKSLESIKKSIEEQGVINPVVVYKEQDKYQLIAGERRTFASLMAGKNEIPAKILPSKPDDLKLSLLQWVENIERQDLSLWERVRNLQKITSAYGKEHNIDSEKITATILGHLVGCSTQQAACYKALIQGPSELLTLICEEKINNLDKAAFIARAPHAQQQALIQACLNNSSLKELKKLAKQKIDLKKTITGRRGRIATKVSFGTTQNPEVAKIILAAVLEHPSYTHLKEKFEIINWDDYKSVSQSFQKLIKALEDKHTTGT